MSWSLLVKFNFAFFLRLLWQIVTNFYLWLPFIYRLISFTVLLPTTIFRQPSTVQYLYHTLLSTAIYS